MTANRLTQWQIGELAAARCTGSLGLAAALMSLVANHPIAAIAAYCVLMAYTLWLLRGEPIRADRPTAESPQLTGTRQPVEPTHTPQGVAR